MDFKKLTVKLILLIFVIIILCCGLYFVFLKSKFQNSIVYYKQGLEYYNKGDYQNAYYNFSKIYPADKLFLNATYKEAKCADFLNDYKTALRKYSVLEFFIKDENITPFILWRKGNIYLNSNSKLKAKSEFLKLRKEYKTSEYGIAANYKLANLVDNKKEFYLIEYLKNSPKGKFSKNAIELLSKEKNLPTSNKDKITIAKAMLENQQYMECIKVLKAVPINLSWVYLIQALDKLNSPENIIKVGASGVLFDNSDIDEETLENAISIYIKNVPQSGEKTSKEIFDKSMDNNTKGVALYKNIQYSDPKAAYLKKSKFYEKFPSSRHAPYVLYDLFMENLISGKNILALKFGKIYLSLYNNKEITPCVLYFTSYIKKQQLDPSYKESAYEIIEKYPNSYYAFLSYKNLINPKFLTLKKPFVTKKTYIEFPYKENKKAGNFYGNFIDLQDFSPFEDFRIKDLTIKSWIEYKKGNRALSSVLARDYILNSEKLPKRSEAVWKLAYPVYYGEEINRYSKERNLNPYLILALIKEESHFDPNIESAVGAVGLMQVLPSTAEMVTGSLFSKSSLKTEDLNISVGTAYFKYLMENFLNKEELCVISYNSGPNAVKRWMDKNNNLPFDIFVEKIPYSETKTYIKKVFGAYWNYLLTYENIKL